MIPHLGPWIGAVAGLRAVVMFQALFAIWRFRRNLLRTIRDRFDARPGDALCAFISAISFFVVLIGVYGMTFVLSIGHAPTDLEAWSRAFAAAAYITGNFAFTMLITGVTTRAAGKVKGVKAFRRWYKITAVMMLIGAFL